MIEWIGAAVILVHSFYDLDCCSDKDCYVLPDGHIQESAEGYVIPETGEVLAYHNNSRVRFSPDGKWHRCSFNGMKGSRTICLYVPGRGS